MKLEKIILDKKYDILTNVKNAFVLQAISYAKVYELLHKQIWRKTPYRIWKYTNPKYTHHNGRPVVFISGWNIKSYSSAPYSYAGGDHTFGLNQLFVGQDYRKTYIGNPKDGIYHDDCFIQPKRIEVTSGQINAWVYYSHYEYAYDGEGGSFSHIYTYDTALYYAENVDNNGQNLVTNAVYETYMDGTTQKHRVIQTNANGSTSTIELGVRTDSTSGIRFAEVRAITGASKTWVYHFNLLGHGAVVHEEYSAPSWSWLGLSDAGWTRCYEDGTVVQYNPETYDGGDSGGSSPAHYIVLPMMYTDTGDLAMDMVEFVEKWNDYFELIVHEDSEWWEAFIKPIAAIITVVVAVYTGVIFNPIGAIGTALSVVGTLGGDRTLGLIGGIMMIGAGMYEMGLEGYANQLYEGGAVGTQADVIGDATFGKAFEGLPNIGLENLAKIGSKIYSITNDIKMLGMKMHTMEQAVENESGMSIIIKDDSEEDLFAELYKMIGV